ncbi:MAG: AAA family ATPase [Pirellulales bacterium]
MAGILFAISGKGGSGKTTLAAMMVRELIRIGKKPVLAVDADPNATLGMALGASYPGTIADLRDEMMEVAKKPSEVPKDRLMDQWLAELVSEQVGFDLLTMGRPEGPNCYCYVNGLLRRYLKLLRDNYPCVVVDCEAGMEHLSRLTVDDVNTLVLVAEPTGVGLATAKRIAHLSEKLPIRVGQRILAVNKARESATNLDLAQQFADLPALRVGVQVPFDEDLADRSYRGEPIDENAGLAARQAISELTRECLAPASGPRKE